MLCVFRLALVSNIYHPRHPFCGSVSVDLCLQHIIAASEKVSILRYNHAVFERLMSPKLQTVKYAIS